MNVYETGQAIKALDRDLQRIKNRRIAVIQTCIKEADPGMRKFTLTLIDQAERALGRVEKKAQQLHPNANVAQARWLTYKMQLIFDLQDTLVTLTDDANHYLHPKE